MIVYLSKKQLSLPQSLTWTGQWTLGDGHCLIHALHGEHSHSGDIQVSNPQELRESMGVALSSALNKTGPLTPQEALITLYYRHVMWTCLQTCLTPESSPDTYKESLFIAHLKSLFNDPLSELQLELDRNNHAIQVLKTSIKTQLGSNEKVQEKWKEQRSGTTLDVFITDNFDSLLSDLDTHDSIQDYNDCLQKQTQLQLDWINSDVIKEIYISFCYTQRSPSPHFFFESEIGLVQMALHSGSTVTYPSPVCLHTNHGEEQDFGTVNDAIVTQYEQLIKQSGYTIDSPEYDLINSATRFLSTTGVQRHIFHTGLHYERAINVTEPPRFSVLPMLPRMTLFGDAPLSGFDTDLSGFDPFASSPPPIQGMMGQLPFDERLFASCLLNLRQQSPTLPLRPTPFKVPSIPPKKRRIRRPKFVMPGDRPDSPDTKRGPDTKRACFWGSI